MNLTQQGWAYYNMNRPAIDRLFSIKLELEVEAFNETDLKKKKYLLDQAALRDNKARELLDRVLAHAKTLGEKVFTKEALYNYANAVPSIRNCNALRHNLNYSWWNTWISNFVSFKAV